jgi:fibronectin type 3 domain-containing protein
MTEPRVTRRVGVALLAVLALAGCGSKGRPVAPEERAPHPIGDLHGLVRGGAIEVTWSTPRRRVDNSPLRDAAESRLYRFEDDPATGAPRSALLADGKIVGYAEIAAIRLADPPSPLVQGGRVVYTDRRALNFGRRYTYVVLTADARGRVSPPSPRLSVTFIAAPEPPAARAEAGEHEVRLTWRPPARHIDGTAVTGALTYEVLRGATADALAPVRRTAAGETSFVDRDAQNDRAYAYAVRAIRTEGTAVAESEPSSPVVVTPVDVTPPSPPRDLVAILSDGTVRLSWLPSPEPDVAAYVVYRADGGAAAQRIGRVPVPGTTFVDRNVGRGQHRYAVTAQDSGTRANESARSREVTVDVP